MAHLVKCYYCGKQFDRDKEPTIQIPNTRRYAHKSCADGSNTTPERKDQIQLEEYIKKLFKMDYVPPNVQNQIKEYIEQKGFTYSGIYKTLFYYFDIMHNVNTYLNNPTIAIVPYVYPQAREYYYVLYQAKKLNENKKFEKPKEVTITIRAPEREPLRKRDLFTFLDEEVDDNGK